MCEYVITSDKDFFEKIGFDETLRYFKTAYKFVCNYQNLGEEFIISSKIHMDETTPHMHIVFVPVVHKTDTKSGKQISKIACSEYWKGKDSYKRLQNNFYNYMTKSGFDLERGQTGNTHIETDKLKRITNYELQKYEVQSINLENEKEITDTEELKKEYKRIIRKFNTLAKHYTRIKELTNNITEQCEEMKIEYSNIKIENTKLKQENRTLKSYINKSIEWMSIVLNWSFDRVNKLINDFIERKDNNGKREHRNNSNRR